MRRLVHLTATGAAGYQTPAHRVSQTVGKKEYSVGGPSPHTPRQSGPDGLSDRRASSRDEVPAQKQNAKGHGIVTAWAGHIAAPTAPPTHVRTQRCVSLPAKTSRPGPAGGALAAELVQRQSIASGFESAEDLGRFSVPRHELDWPEPATRFAC